MPSLNSSYGRSRQSSTTPSGFPRARSLSVAARPGFLLACVRKFGPWSSYIYVLHVIVIGFYQQHLCNPLLAALPGSDRLEPYLTPLLVAGLSLLMAIAYERGEWLLRRLRRRK